MSRRRRRRTLRAPRNAGETQVFLTTEALIEATGFSRERLWRARRDGGLRSGIHFVRVGRRLLWHLPNFRAWARSLDLRVGDGAAPEASCAPASPAARETPSD